MPPRPHPEIRFTGGSTDAEKIRFFGTLMPALMRFAQWENPHKSGPSAARHNLPWRLALRPEFPDGLPEFVTFRSDPHLSR